MSTHAATATVHDGQARGQDDVLQCLTFDLGGDVFAIDIRSVREIVQQVQITVVPRMPDFVRGVINLRGAVVPVIDLQARLGRACAQIGKKTSVVIYEAEQPQERQELGLLVESVSEVVDISMADLVDPPMFGTPIAREYIRGLGKVGEAFVPILDAGRALDMDDMAAAVARHGE